MRNWPSRSTTMRRKRRKKTRARIPKTRSPETNRPTKSCWKTFRHSDCKTCRCSNDKPGNAFSRSAKPTCVAKSTAAKFVRKPRRCSPNYRPKFPRRVEQSSSSDWTERPTLTFSPRDGAVSLHPPACGKVGCTSGRGGVVREAFERFPSLRTQILVKPRRNLPGLSARPSLEKRVKSDRTASPRALDGEAKKRRRQCPEE